jgi:hypothetical protein
VLLGQHSVKEHRPSEKEATLSSQRTAIDDFVENLDRLIEDARELAKRLEQLEHQHLSAEREAVNAAYRQGVGDERKHRTGFDLKV